MVEICDTTSIAAQYAQFAEALESRRKAFQETMRAAEDREEQRAISDTFD